MDDELTDAELTVLGLVGERPRHGYDLESVIEARGVREWTALGFSSIYYILKKLESRGLVSSSRPDSMPKGRRIYAITGAGTSACAHATRKALAEPRPTYPSVLVGLANSPVLSTHDVVDALRQRSAGLEERLAAVRAAKAAQEPLAGFVSAIFDHGTTMIEAECAWIIATISTLEGIMDKSDVKRDRKDLYAPPAGDFHIVEVPEMAFLMIDGEGDPNTARSYRDATETLYAISYALKFASKKLLGKDYTVAPLEGLWSAEDPAAFWRRSKGEWHWTMMITQPDWITADMVDDAMRKAAAKKDLPGLAKLRYERYAEGRAVQILHIGSYDDETPVLGRLHDEYLPAHGLMPSGRHHEIYLGDPRKTEPGKLETILRQPVTAQTPPPADADAKVTAGRARS
jgi:DNA-binding PadR family transcriptional regulator